MDSVGENIARLHSQADPLKVVSGWMSSPGHRANLLDPAWKQGGVGAAVVGDNAYFTHLFGIPADLWITDISLDASVKKQWMVRCRARIACNEDLIGFVASSYNGSAPADEQGIAMLEVWTDLVEARTQVSFAAARRGTSESIGFFDGWLERAANNSVRWRRGWQSEGAVILEDSAYAVEATELGAHFSGYTRTPACVVVDGRVVHQASTGALKIRVSLRANSGSHVIDLGVPVAGTDEYIVKRRFEVDSNAATLREVRA
jgi:hypothetical protein